MSWENLWDSGGRDPNGELGKASLWCDNWRGVCQEINAENSQTDRHAERLQRVPRTFATL